jgi:dihydroorotate dehydrogenase
MLDRLYRIARPMLFQLDAETAHRLTLAMLSACPLMPRPADPPELTVKLWGMDLSNPVGLAAGMDKDAIALGAWQALGFGFAELGTVTPRPQAGHPRPRVFRIPQRRALINRLGFPSDGMEAVAARIERWRRMGIRMRLGINLGPNKDAAGEAAAADYAALLGRLGALADFIVINISSPNTPGLRDWQRPERMRELFASIDAAARGSDRRPPIVVKLAPDLESADFHRICDTVIELKLDGIVACNTTLARSEVGVTTAHEGGLSGEPLRERARAVIREIYRHTAGKVPIIGVGGIASADDAYAHIRAGASLVELYTALVYDGPGLPAAINAGLVRLLRRDGLSSIMQAVGAAA